MKYTPKIVEKKFTDVNYHQLKKEGYNTIFTDLDNTLAKYSDANPSDELIKQIKQIKELGFKIYILSNNNSKRANHFVKELKIDGALSKANKPHVNRINQFMLEKNIEKEKVVAVGDQLVTDIAAYNKAGLYSVFVKTMDTKNQKWYTKVNRLREKRIIKKINNENPDIGRKIEQL